MTDKKKDATSPSNTAPAATPIVDLQPLPLAAGAPANEEKNAANKNTDTPKPNPNSDEEQNKKKNQLDAEMKKYKDDAAKALASADPHLAAVAFGRFGVLADEDPLVTAKDIGDLGRRIGRIGHKEQKPEDLQLETLPDETTNLDSAEKEKKTESPDQKKDDPALPEEKGDQPPVVPSTDPSP